MKPLHNSGTAAKVQLRRMLLQQLGHPAYRVFEFYGGPGEMRRQAWHDAVEVVSVDADIESEADYLGDSILTARHLDLTRFDVFDIDPFSNPWEGVHALSRAPREAGRRIGVVVTDGACGPVFRRRPNRPHFAWGRQAYDALRLEPGCMMSEIGMTNRTFETSARRMLGGMTGWRIEWFAAAWGGGSTGKHGGTLYAAAVLVTP